MFKYLVGHDAAATSGASLVTCSDVDSENSFASSVSRSRVSSPRSEKGQKRYVDDSQAGITGKRRRVKENSPAHGMYSDAGRAYAQESMTLAPFFNYRDHSQDLDDDPLTPITSPGKAPNFLAKLHAILSNHDLSHIVTWLPHGRSWQVLDPEEFESKVLPTYFEHSKLSSFIRQTNGWGFCRVSHGKNRNSYYHELFLRGLPHLCKKMKRPGASKKGIVDSRIIPDFYEISRLLPLPESTTEDIMMLECALKEGPRARMPVQYEALSKSVRSALISTSDASHDQESTKKQQQKNDSINPTEQAISLECTVKEGPKVVTPIGFESSKPSLCSESLSSICIHKSVGSNNSSSTHERHEIEPNRFQQVANPISAQETANMSLFHTALRAAYEKILFQQQAQQQCVGWQTDSPFHQYGLPVLEPPLSQLPRFRNIGGITTQYQDLFCGLNYGDPSLTSSIDSNVAINRVPNALSHASSLSYPCPNPFAGQSSSINPFAGQSSPLNPSAGQSKPLNPLVTYLNQLYENSKGLQ